jgi:hypothetical protein
MRIRIDHTRCRHGLEANEACLARVLRNPLALEPGCAAEIVEDGRTEMAVTLILDGKGNTLILRNPREVEYAAVEGSAAFRRGSLRKVGA